MLKPIIIAAAALAAIATTPALARDVPTRIVATADLDLSTAAGQRKLDRRIASATEAVCGSYAGARDGEEDRIKACRAQVAEQVRPAVAAARSRAQLALRD